MGVLAGAEVGRSESQKAKTLQWRGAGVRWGVEGGRAAGLQRHLLSASASVALRLTNRRSSGYLLLRRMEFRGFKYIWGLGGLFSYLSDNGVGFQRFGETAGHTPVHVSRARAEKGVWSRGVGGGTGV